MTDPAQAYYLLRPTSTLTFELVALDLSATNDEEARDWAEDILRKDGDDGITYRVVCVTDHLTVHRLPDDEVQITAKRD